MATPNPYQSPKTGADEPVRNTRSGLTRCLWVALGFLIGFCVKELRWGEKDMALLAVASIMVVLGLVGYSITFARKRARRNG